MGFIDEEQRRMMTDRVSMDISNLPPSQRQIYEEMQTTNEHLETIIEKMDEILEYLKGDFNNQIKEIVNKSLDERMHKGNSRLG